jgi:hypothetical protein
MPIQRLLVLLALAAALSGCVSPHVVSYYDADCQVMARKVTLKVSDARALDSCSNNDCVAQVLGRAVVTASSTVISGSVAVVGNVGYWLERTANCQRKAPAAVLPSASAPPASAPLP